MSNPALRAAAQAAFTNESANVAAAQAAAANAALPANIAARATALQTYYNALDTVMANIIDALNFAVTPTVTGVATHGVVGTNRPSFTLGTQAEITVTFAGVDSDGSTPTWAVTGATTFTAITSILVIRLARFYANNPDATA